MSITLTQRVQEININYTEEPVALEIFYIGSFVGEVLGNTVSGMNNKKIIIVFLTPPEETLIRYYGNFKIKSIKAYSKNNKLIKTKKRTITDEIGHITSKWDESTTTYENYNQSNRYIPKTKSIIACTINGNKSYSDKNGFFGESKLKPNHRNILNRIRSIK